jgi:hypothetical protein
MLPVSDSTFASDSDAGADAGADAGTAVSASLLLLQPFVNNMADSKTVSDERLINIAVLSVISYTNGLDEKPRQSQAIGKCERLRSPSPSS